MYRTHNCGELRLSDQGKEILLSGWVQKSRDLGGMTFVDMRDRYGITQIVFNMDQDELLCTKARKLGREFVIKISGIVKERSSKNPNRDTGDIEIEAKTLDILNESKVPPFLIEDDTDGNEDIRMKYRYLDLRRTPVQKNLIFRSKLTMEVRKFLSESGFLEIETPFLIKSTPEGARDFVVPSRINKGQFYALPQSPQTFKQILMVSGYDKYFQIVKCFRDEDLRADRQPEFTQIDCEMAFVSQEDILNTFESLTKHVFSITKGIILDDFLRMSYDQAMNDYGSDKPDIRFDMKLNYLHNDLKGHGFGVFDEAESIIGIVAKGVGANYANKQISQLTDWVKRPQVGSLGLAYIKHNSDGTIKSSIGKFFTDEQLLAICQLHHIEAGDIMFIMSGELEKTQKRMNDLRLELGQQLGLIKEDDFKPLWVVDFPLLEWDEDANRFFAMHHPFTSPKKSDVDKMLSGDHETLKGLRADAYDLVINGVEIGGGSIRIYDKDLQSKNFELLGFTAQQAQDQFGFLLGAFEYGAPPHGGIAFGLDRLCAVLNHQNSIRDFIAFPKNNQGRDVMINAPSQIDCIQLDELSIVVKSANE